MKLNNVTEKAKKETMSFKDVVMTHKKDTIIAGCIFGILFIIWIVCLVLNASMKKQSENLNVAIAQYSNAIREERNNSLQFGDGLTRTNTETTYTGALFDGKRWTEDNQLAYDVFFSKAFNFANWGEYEANRSYFKELFHDDHNIFTATVMFAILDPDLDTRYQSDAERQNAKDAIHSTLYGVKIASDPANYATVNATSGYAMTYLTGISDDVYDYVAVIKPVSVSIGNQSAVTTYVARYSVDRSSGTPNFIFEECWPLAAK